MNDLISREDILNLIDDKNQFLFFRKSDLKERLSLVLHKVKSRETLELFQELHEIEIKIIQLWEIENEIKQLKNSEKKNFSQSKSKSKPNGEWHE